MLKIGADAWGLQREERQVPATDASGGRIRSVEELQADELSQKLAGRRSPWLALPFWPECVGSVEQMRDGSKRLT